MSKNDKQNSLRAQYELFKLFHKEYEKYKSKKLTPQEKLLDELERINPRFSRSVYAGFKDV
ncbi:MAG: hypothetical protein ACE5OZ_02090 [Candidatus Heimdallarchaeota archaeon]